jgi:hypothetical protein
MDETQLLKSLKHLRSFRDLNREKKVSDTQEAILRIIIRDAKRLLETK